MGKSKDQVAANEERTIRYSASKMSLHSGSTRTV